jgi:hypothetical protein
MQINESDLYRTKDFANASALLALGFTLLFLDRTSADGRADFVFERQQDIEKCAEAHFAGKLKIATNQYYSAQRTLKSRLHNS